MSDFPLLVPGELTLDLHAERFQLSWKLLHSGLG